MPLTFGILYTVLYKVSPFQLSKLVQCACPPGNFLDFFLCNQCFLRMCFLSTKTFYFSASSELRFPNLRCILANSQAKGTILDFWAHFLSYE